MLLTAPQSVPTTTSGRPNLPRITLSSNTQVILASDAHQSSIDIRWVSDCHMGVGFVTAQSTRHMHYTMTCLSGDCVVLVTITVTADSYTREELCRMGVGWVYLVQ